MSDRRRCITCERCPRQLSHQSLMQLSAKADRWLKPIAAFNAGKPAASTIKADSQGAVVHIVVAR